MPAERELITKAIDILARRALDAAPNSVLDAEAWLAEARRRRAARHHQALTELDPTAFATPDQLADHLEPRTPRRPDPLDATQAAAGVVYAANAVRRERPCPTCSGARRLISDGPDNVAVTCPACDGTGIAA